MKKKDDVYAQAKKLTEYELSRRDKELSAAMEKAHPGFTKYYKKKLLEDNIKLLKGEPLIDAKEEGRKLEAANNLYCMLGLYDIHDYLGIRYSPGGPMMIGKNGKLYSIMTESRREALFKEALRKIK